MRATIATVLLAVAGAVGCGPDGGGSADPVPVEDFAARTSESDCGYLLRCCDDADLTSVFLTEMPPSTLAECQALLQPGLEMAFNTLSAAVESGRAEWDAQAAGDCLAEHESLECGELARGAASDTCLHAAIRGTVADGGACTLSVECVSQTCNLSSHTCVPRARIGESCTGSFLCEAGAICRADGAGGATCMTLGAEGDPCTIGTECVSGTCTADHCAAAMPLCDGRR